MPWPFSRKKKEPDPDEEFQRSEVLAEQQADAARSADRIADEMRASLGRTIYMVYDPDVQDTFVDDKKPILNSMLPAFSFLNRTTNIDEKEKRLLQLEYEQLKILAELGMKEEDYETRGWLEQEAFGIYAMGIMNDAEGGWKGKLLTEQIKKIITELRQPEKKRSFL